ncbi:MAG: efflux RND transporter periplasmic adaptor subunit [Burkholderiales bacterium]
MKPRLRMMMAALLCMLGAGAYAKDEPSVLVTTGVIKQQELADVLTGYGTVVPDVGSTVNINLPRPGQVSRLLVSPGQIVKSGVPLLEFNTGAAAALGYQQAASALAFAQEELKRVEEMVSQQLATQSQLAAARKSVTDAEAALQAQRNLGAGISTQQVIAPFDGIVFSIPVAQGDRLAAGASVVQFARLTGMRVQLGIEPADSDRVKPGMPVRLTSVLDSNRTFEAKVDQVHGMVNPQTQLVDVVVRLGGTTLIPGMRVRGEITIARTNTWIVPRSAVLRDSQGAYIFQVKDNRAQRVNVRTGTESDNVVGISGNFDPKLRVVVLGNYELKDGMAVRETAE